LQHEGDGGGERGFEWKDAVGGVAGEESAGFGGAKGESGEEASGGEGAKAEGGHFQGVCGELEGGEDVLVEGGGVVDEGSEEGVVGGAIQAECFGGEVEGAVEDGGAAVFEGMSERDLGVDPFEAFSGEIEFVEDGRGDCGGVDGGADVVMEAWEGEFLGASAATWGGAGFGDEDFAAVAGEVGGGGQAVGA